MKGQLRRFPHRAHKQQERDDLDRGDMLVHTKPPKQSDGGILLAPSEDHLGERIVVGLGTHIVGEMVQPH